MIVTVPVGSRASTALGLQNFLVEHGDNADEGDFLADAMEWGSTRLINEDDDAGEIGEEKDGDESHLPQETEQNPEQGLEQAKVPVSSANVEPSKSSWFRRARRKLQQAPLSAQNVAKAGRERVRVEEASPECMRTRRARIRDERARERGMERCTTELDQSTQRSTVIADITEAALNLIQSSLGARPKVDGLGPALDP